MRSAIANKNDPRNAPAIVHTVNLRKAPGTIKYTDMAEKVNAKDALIINPPPRIDRKLIRGFSTAKKKAVNIPTSSSSVMS
jgi:hypothetical protein